MRSDYPNPFAGARVGQTDSHLGCGIAPDNPPVPAIRIGRRVRVRRVDLDGVLAQGAAVEIKPQASMVAPADAVEQLTEALERRPPTA